MAETLIRGHTFVPDYDGRVGIPLSPGEYREGLLSVDSEEAVKFCDSYALFVFPDAFTIPGSAVVQTEIRPSEVKDGCFRNLYWLVDRAITEYTRLLAERRFVGMYPRFPGGPVEIDEIVVIDSVVIVSTRHVEDEESGE